MKDFLTRTECSAMRGIAILGIMLHNYCHFLKDIVRENEYTWTSAKCDRLWTIIQQPDEFFPIHLFSFFGHYGVPVFLFLSGFGLVMKYESHDATGISGLSGFWRFFRYNWLKLFRILVVGFVLFTMIDAMTYGMHRYQWHEVVGVLGMFANVFENPSQVIWPGPYWYFGLTLQVYILYRLVFWKWRHWGVVIAAIVVCWLFQVICLDDAETLERLRYNFIGGMLPFGMGILLARVTEGRFFCYIARYNKRTVPLLRLAGGIVMLSVVLVTAMSMNQQTWLWVPVFIVIGTIVLVKYLPHFILRPLEWVGGISAAIFVSHPIVRKLFVRPYAQDDLYAGLILYTVAALVVGWLLMQVINKIPKPKL